MTDTHPPAEKWTCPARATADPPQDCNWPFCGCDERASAVIEMLLECGWIPHEEASEMRERLVMLETANQLNKETIAAMGGHHGS